MSGYVVNDLGSWVVFLHVVAVIGFAMAHGVSAGVAFKLKTEDARELPRVQALLHLSAASLGAMYIALFALLVSGVLAGFMRGWWTSGRLWIWVSLLVFVLVAGVMYGVANPYLTRVRRAAGVEYRDRGKEMPAAPADEAALREELARGRPELIAAVGLGGLAILTWLMMFRPF